MVPKVLHSKIIGVGGYLPEKLVTNFDLEKTIDTSDEWIKSRTGIAQRHIAAEDEFTSHLGYKAALAAISNANISKDEIDLIITCTNTPDNTFPSTANKIQGYLGVGNIPSFDLQAICSGFLYGLQTADSMIKSGKYRTVLLVCADKMSSILDWQDRKTCVLFGDGAGALVLRKSDALKSDTLADSTSDSLSSISSDVLSSSIPTRTLASGIIDCEIFSDGKLADILYTDGGVSSSGKSGVVQMVGQEVFKKAVERMSESVHNILKKNHFTIDDVSYLIPHQANLRIISNMVNQFGISQDKVVVTIDKHANCSAASIPLALGELQLTKTIKSGDILVFTAFGAGATWGAAIVRW